MRESEYLLVSNLQRLNAASEILSHVLFMDEDPRQKEAQAAQKTLRKLIDGIYAELDGKIEEDPE